MTGANVWIDLNPAGTGSKTIISITPSAALVGASTWYGIEIQGAALDPGNALATIIGMNVDFDAIDMTQQPFMRGFQVLLPANYNASDAMAFYISGDGKIVKICDDTYALHVDAGNVKFDGNISVDGTYAFGAAAEDLDLGAFDLTNVTQIRTQASSDYNKILLYSSGTYAIGMVSAITYGYLNDYAMTFLFNNENDRGFWWGDSAHSKAQGAMSLTTDGQLFVDLRVAAPEFCSTIDPQHKILMDPAADEIQLYPGDVAGDRHIVFASAANSTLWPLIRPDTDKSGYLGHASFAWLGAYIGTIFSHDNHNHRIIMDPAADQIRVHPGDAAGDNYVIFKSVDTGATSPQIYPSANGEGYLGLSGNYWDRIYAQYYYGSNLYITGGTAHQRAPSEFFYGSKNIGDNVATAICRITVVTNTCVWVKLRMTGRSNVDIAYANTVGEWIIGLREYGGGRGTSVCTVCSNDLGSANPGFADIGLPTVTVGGAGLNFDITVQQDHTGASGSTVTAQYTVEAMDLLTPGTGFGRYSITGL